MNFPKNNNKLSFKKRYLNNDHINSIYFIDLQSFCRTLIDEEYSKIINSKKSVVFSDGFFVHKILKNIGSVYLPGPDFLTSLVYNVDNLLFLGPSNDSILKFREVLKKRNIDLFVDYVELPFYRNIKELDLDTISNIIIKKKIKYIAVILGCPKQELLISNLVNKNDGFVFFGLGAAFNFFIGSESRGPKAFRKIKLEWLVRLFFHPKKQIPKYFLIFKSIPYLFKHLLNLNTNKINSK